MPFAADTRGRQLPPMWEAPVVTLSVAVNIPPGASSAPVRLVIADLHHVETTADAACRNGLIADDMAPKAASRRRGGKLEPAPKPTEGKHRSAVGSASSIGT